MSTNDEPEAPPPDSTEPPNEVAGTPADPNALPPMDDVWAAAFAEAEAEAQEKQSAVAEGSDGATATATDRPRRPLVLIVGAAVVLVVVLGAGAWFLQSSNTPPESEQPDIIVESTAPPRPTATATRSPAQMTAVAQATRITERLIAGACGALRVQLSQAPVILNPHLATSQSDLDASRLVLEPLAAWDAQGNLVPVLAESLPTVANGAIAKDFASVTWHLRHDVRWSDGSPLTAADIVFTYQYIADAKTGATDTGTIKNIKSVESPDAYTVRVIWQSPNPVPYDVFVGRTGAILQKKQFEPFIGSRASTGPNLKPIGTGPFIARDAQPGSLFNYDRNPNYREAGTGKPCFKEVRLKGGGSANDAAQAVLSSGDADFAPSLNLEPSVLAAVAGRVNPRGVLLTARGPYVERILLNRSNSDAALGTNRAEPNQPNPYLNDVRVRQALALMVDTTAIGKDIWSPAAEGTCLLLNAPPLLVSRNVTCSQAGTAALSNANRLLDEAGWLKGADGIRHKAVNGRDLPLHLVFQTSADGVRQTEQATIQVAWEKLGIQIDVKSVPSNVFFGRSPASPDTAAKFFADVEMFTDGAASTDPASHLQNWTCAEIKTRDQNWSGNNYERWCNKEYDMLIAQLQKEGDPARRAQLAIQAQDMLVYDVVDIPIASRKVVSAYAKTLQGVDLNPWDSELWNVAGWYN